jgi:hypothetical protein
LKENKRTKTIDVITAAKDRELIVAGELVDMHFPKGAGLSLRAAKAWVAMLDHAGAQILDDIEHTAPLREIVKGWHQSSHELEEIVQELHQTTISLTYVDRSGLRRRKSTVLVADIDRPLDTDAAEIKWRYSNGVRQLVKNSHHWAAISARAVYAMECKYSPWLYQLAALHAGRREVSRDWPLHELRERLGVTAPSLRRWQDFKRVVLEPAVAEVNHLTGVRIDWQPVKRGRTVVAVRLACWCKDDKEIKEAAAEQARPRPGRKARRQGTVEQIAEEQATLRREIEESLASLPLSSVE